LVKEGAETLSEEYEDAVMDAAIIGAAQRVEHYEIAAYGTARAFAELLGENEHVSLLEQTLQEEKETDEKLTQLSEQINSEAAEGEEMETETDSEAETRQPSKSKSKRAA
jgi:ferritin-like metal-binding protein YciE